VQTDEHRDECVADMPGVTGAMNWQFWVDISRTRAPGAEDNGSHYTETIRYRRGLIVGHEGALKGFSA
jgi:hypothetical protein